MQCCELNKEKKSNQDFFRDNSMSFGSGCQTEIKTAALY